MQKVAPRITKKIRSRLTIDYKNGLEFPSCYSRTCYVSQSHMFTILYFIQKDHHNVYDHLVFHLSRFFGQSNT